MDFDGRVQHRLPFIYSYPIDNNQARTSIPAKFTLAPLLINNVDISTDSSLIDSFNALILR